jgi:molybdate transport system permease protein
VLGASPWRVFWRIVFPLSRTSFVTAAVLTFAHTVGEFGVVLMIGGSIPGVTRVASIALYDEVQTLDYDSAHRFAAVLLGCSFALLLAVTLLQRGRRRQ